MGGAGATGWDWVLTAYALARKHFPASTRLLINEYGVVSDSGARAKYTFFLVHPFIKLSCFFSFVFER